MRKLFLLALALMLIAGCGGKANLFIEGYVYRMQTWSDNFWGERNGTIMSDPVVAEVTVTISNDTMAVDVPGPENIYQTAHFWDEDTVPQEAGTEQAFDIRTDVGNASATCTVPGDFDITVPLDGDSIPLNADCEIAWGASSGTDWYMVQLYYNTSGGDYIDTLVYIDSATTWTIPAAFLNADGWLAFYVYAGDGPKVEPGAEGNIEGAKGFCIAMNARANQVTVGTPVFAAAKNDIPEISARDIYKGYIREMSKYSSEAGEMLEYLE